MWVINKQPVSAYFSLDYPIININDLSTFLIPDIQPADQTRIVTELDAREARIRELKAAILGGYL
jgi:restriction endonuclease S subunit